MKRSIMFLAILLLAGCAAMGGKLRGCSAANRGGSYSVTVWSGGVAVANYQVVGFVNSESQSDGWFFTTQDGKFHRVAGTITIDEK